MTTRLFDHMTEIGQRIVAAERVLVGLDYDGTLTPLVNDPARATLEPNRREVLRDLAARPGVAVAIISGRALDDVRDLVNLPGLIYAGNHGLDIAGPGLRFIDPAALATQDSLRKVADNLTARTSVIPGVWVEDKALTLSIHVRRAAPVDHGRVRRLVERAAAGSGFRVTPGNQVFEVRPRTPGAKGVALRWIRETLALPMTLYAGDDFTDEDAFRALPDGITIRVGRAVESCARYTVAGPDAMWSFLAWLHQALWSRRRMEVVPT
jgi:trehalose 6-phosphate phosphatase